MLVTIFTDASFCHKTSAAGWAVWAKCQGETYRNSGGFKQSIAAPVEAEIGAIVNGVYLITNSLKITSADKLLIQTDCEEAIAFLSGKGIMKTNFTMSKMKAKYAGLLLACGVPTVEFRHVKGHRGTRDPRAAVNTWCDKAARKHMLTQRQTKRT